MEKFRLLPGIILGTLFYVVMAIVAGRDGIWACSQLRGQMQAISAHTTDIENTHTELLLEKIALQKDPEIIAAFAKKLGYISDGEKLIKVSGLRSHDAHIFDAGSILRHSTVQYLPEWICKACGLAVFFVISFFRILFDFVRGLIQIPEFRKNDASAA